MLRIARATVLAFLLVGCGRESAPEIQAGNPARPPLAHVPSDVPSVPAETLVHARFAAEQFEMGPHALLQDSAAWLRFWSRSGVRAPDVNFSTTTVLALRVYDTVTFRAASPRVSTRAGMTFVVITKGIGPLRPSGADSVVLYHIRVENGPVRTVTYGQPR